MEVFATFITIALLFLWVLVRSQDDQCNYQISPEISKVMYIGVYFSQVNLSANESLLVSYTWGGQRFTDKYSNLNSITFLKYDSTRVPSITQCFGDINPYVAGTTTISPITNLSAIFWSEEPVTIMYIHPAPNSGDCTTPTTSYAANYFTETCGGIITLTSLQMLGSLSFPRNYEIVPCNVDCTWVVQTFIAGSSIALWVNGYHNWGTLTITSLNDGVGFQKSRCSVYGDNGLSKLYVSDFGTKVSINYCSFAAYGVENSFGGDKFTIEFELIDQSDQRDIECSVGNVAVLPAFCQCKLISFLRENGYAETRSVHFPGYYTRDDIKNVTAVYEPQQITCKKCADNFGSTTTSTETSTYPTTTTTTPKTTTTSIQTSQSTTATSTTEKSTTTPSTTTATTSTSTRKPTTSTPAKTTNTAYFTTTMSPTEYISTLFTTAESTHPTTKKASTAATSTVTQSTTTTTTETPPTVSDSYSTLPVTIITTTAPSTTSINTTFITSTTEISTADLTSNTSSDTTTTVFTKAPTSFTETSSVEYVSTSTNESSTSTRMSTTTVSTTTPTISTVVSTSESITFASSSKSEPATTQNSTSATSSTSSSLNKSTSETTTASSPAATTTTEILILTTSSTILPTTTMLNNEDQDLAHIKDNMTLDNVDRKLQDLTNILLNITTYLTQENVTDAVDALSAAAEIANISREAGQDFDKSADITLTNGSESFTTETTNKLLNAVKNYGKNVNLTVGQSSEFFNGSSFVNVVTVVNCSEPQFPIGLIDLVVDKNASSVGTIFNNQSNDNLVTGMVGYIAIAPYVICSNESQKTKSGQSEATRVSFQLYRTTKIFSTTTNKPTTRSSYCNQTFTYPGDVVVSATVVERLGNQVEPQMSVQIGFQRSLNPQIQTLSRNYRTYCGYWQNGNWTDNSNMKLLSQTGEIFIFHSDHLTDFTLLTSTNPKERIFCETGLDILGTVGSSCSFAGLTFMSISLLIIRWARLSTNPIVLLSLFFNFSFALFFICFILFADQLTFNISDSACTAFGAIMYYLLMSTMMWTCCRAALVYKRYVIVFDTGRYSKFFTFNKVSTFLSTVIPFVIVLTVGLTDNPFFERQDYFCWINPAYAGYAVVIPISIMLIMSIIVLIMVVRSVFFSSHPETSIHRSRKNDRKTFRRKIWVLFVIQISLGLPWIFLYLTEIPGTSVFHYLFTITNAFQGVWIAALHFYERRKDLGKLLRQATLTRSAHSVVTQNTPLDTPKATVKSAILRGQNDFVHNIQRAKLSDKTYNSFNGDAVKVFSAK